MKYHFLLPILLGICVFSFFGLLYPAHLNFLEQLQMFTYDWACFSSHLDHPGGLAEYAGEFFTQFYFNPWLGAVIVAFFVVGVQQLSSPLIKACGVSQKKADWSSLLPALFLWSFWLDKHGLTSFGVSLAVILLAANGITRISSLKWRMAYEIVGLIILYYLAGPVCILFAIFAMVYERKNILLLSSILFLTLSIPLLSYFFVSYPLSQLYFGIGYYRVADGIPNFKLDMQEEEALSYDKMVRFKQWDAIIDKAQRTPPSDITSMQCVNLALSMRGQLVERLLDFPQTCAECLISGISEQMSSPFPVSDIHYWLGFINSAERYAYDIQQSQPIPYIRTWIRLAEANIINDQYTLAEKYLQKISKTHFYGKWANKMMEYLNDENKIMENDEFFSLRNKRLKNDVYYSSKDMDYMLSRLVVENPNNSQVYDYLVSYLLLKCDLDKFVCLFPNRNEHQMPRVIQEALVFAWMQKHPNFNEIPWVIDPSILRSAVEFAQLSTQIGEKPTEELKKQYGQTYWYYYIYTSNRK